MIIQSLQAQDFGKFLHLRVQGVPSDGLVVVVGNTETGKTTIGDALSFVFFGVTERLNAKSAFKLVRWGCSEAIVQVCFQINDQALLIERSITAQGQTTVAIWDRSNNQVLADSPAKVQAFLQTTLGYGYKVFSRTFYWGQRFSEDPSADNDSVLAMAGLQVYQQTRSAIDHDHGVTQLNSERFEQTLKDTELNLHSTQCDPMRLPWLTEVRTELNVSQQQNYALAEQISEEARVYGASYPEYHRLKQKIQKFTWGAMAALGLMLVLLIAAWLSVDHPEWIASSLAHYGNPAIWGALLLALAAGGAMIYGHWITIHDLNPLHSKAGLLAQRLFTGYRIMSTALDDLLHPATVDWLREKHLNTENDDALMDMQSLGNWSTKVENYEIEPLDLRHIAEGLAINLQRRQQYFGSLVSRVDEDIRRESSLQEEHATFTEHYAANQQAVSQVQRHLQVQLMAQGLILRSMQQAALRFNAVIAQRGAALIQVLTQGHYQSVELRNDLNLYVQSTNGQVDHFEAISVDAQRQIALAMRLTLARALVFSHKSRQQCLFFDAPLVNFDDHRLSATLQSLLTVLDQSVSQIWVTTTSYPVGVEGITILDCSTDDNVLDVKLIAPNLRKKQADPKPEATETIPSVGKVA